MDDPVMSVKILILISNGNYEKFILTVILLKGSLKFT